MMWQIRTKTSLDYSILCNDSNKLRKEENDSDEVKITIKIRVYCVYTALHVVALWKFDGA